MKDFLRAVVVIVCIWWINGCATPVKPQDKSVAAVGASYYAAVPTYRIGADDSLSINVWQNPSLSVAVPVRPDGKISVPLIGDIDAGGKTPMEVATIIREKLSVFIREPQVTVILTELRSHEFLSRVRVTGAVQKPVSLPFRQGMTVLDAVLEAGGTNLFAAPDRAAMYRKENNKTERYDVLLDQILTAGKLDTNYPLQPGDIITVPERVF
jgi:polysaccharide export outer membrane protein